MACPDDVSLARAQIEHWTRSDVRFLTCPEVMNDCVACPDDGSLARAQIEHRTRSDVKSLTCPEVMNVANLLRLFELGWRLCGIRKSFCMIADVRSCS